MNQERLQRRVLSVDPGSTRTGLAVSDALGISLKPLGVVPGGIDALNGIVEIAKRESAGAVVVGWPINMDGSEGKSALASRALALALIKALPNTPVYLLDERLSSHEAVEILEKADRKPSRHKHEIDVMSAKLILRAFLDAERRGEKLEPLNPGL